MGYFADEEPQSKRNYSFFLTNERFINMAKEKLSRVLNSEVEAEAVLETFR